MSHWNYRMTVRSIETENGAEEEWAVRELYYDDGDNVPHSWSADPIAFVGETWLELADELARAGGLAANPAFDLDTKSWRKLGGRP